MIYINKGQEPNELKKYRDGWNTSQLKMAQPTYEGMPSDVKDKLREALCQEQGYLCAYCMRKIENNELVMKVEHINPRNNISKHEALIYSNMLGVCLGESKDETRRGEKYETCDKKKGETLINFSPLNKSDMEKISYHTNDGRIYSDDPTIDKELNKVLNLNCGVPQFLPENRKAVIDSVKDSMKRLVKRNKLNRRSIRLIKQKFCEPDSEGRLREYVGIAKWYLDNRS